MEPSAATTQSKRRWYGPGSVLSAAALLLVVATCGCASGVYRAGALPPELQAPAVKDLSQINLVRLAAPAQPANTIAPGDVLDILIVTDYRDRYIRPIPVRVADDGSATVPLVGPVMVAGFTLEDAERAIAAAAIERNIFRNPLVTVTMNKQRTNRVTVVGAVKKEGVYELPRSDSTLLGALVMAGNLSDNADSRIEIRRASGFPRGDRTAPQLPSVAGVPEASLTSYETAAGSGPRLLQVDLLSIGEQPSGDLHLDDGDVVIVNRRKPRTIFVSGLVNRPGRFELDPNEDVRVLDAVAMAGSCSSPLADQAYVIRQVPGGKAVKIKVSLRAAKNNPEVNIPLAAGDVVTVEETALTVGERLVRYFFRFGLTGSVSLF